VDGQITEYRLPDSNHVPADIVAGGDGALWFSESTRNLLGRITVDGRITEYPLAHTPCNTGGVTGPNVIGVCTVTDLIAGPDGGIWFTEGWRDALGRIDASGRITEFPVPRLSKTDSGMPQYFALGPDCALWFTYGDGIGRVQPFSTAPGCSSGLHAP
jgi:virginiamycin B lyase